MFLFLIDIIIKENEKINKNNYVTYIGSPFKGDKMNISYQIEMILNLEKNISEGKIIILCDLEEIYSIFYDLFNQNFIVKNGKKYYHIYYGNNIKKLSLVNENTKIIILIDKNNLRRQKLEFLNRFEKYNISYDIILNEEDKEKSKLINKILKNISSVKEVNYNMENILVNINEDIINGYIYLYKNLENNSYKDIIKDKIIPILPQDILLTLSNLNNEIEKKEYNSLKRDIESFDKYNSLEEYVKCDKKGKEIILLVYTLTKIGETIKLSEKENYLEIITRGIDSIYKFTKILNEFYKNEKYKSLILKFDSENAKYISFFITEINNYKKINKIQHDSKNYIFTINIKREFDLVKNNNKITTIFVNNEEINQIFIDNINGAELSIKEVKNINIQDYIIKNQKKLFVEEIINFFKENQNHILGRYKGIDSNNFIKEFKSFIENEP